jgi:small GTP-binding protein
MIQKKICILGAFAVGKSSLTERYVRSIFSERYRTTVGVRIYKKDLLVSGRELTLIVWDLAGEDEFVVIRTSYLRGASAYLLVVDGTRRDTLAKAVELHHRVRSAVGRIPFRLLINKNDLEQDWAVEEAALDELIRGGWVVMRTSAKTGEGVEEAFQSIAVELAGE